MLRIPGVFEQAREIFEEAKDFETWGEELDKTMFRSLVYSIWLKLKRNYIHYLHIKRIELHFMA